MAFSGIRLKKALSDKNMKQTVLAYRLGVDRSYITNYINGKYSPKYDTIKKMSEILGVSETWLSGYDDEKTKSSPDEPKLSEGEKAVLDLFRAIPEEHQVLALEIVKGSLSALQKK